MKKYIHILWMGLIVLSCCYLAVSSYAQENDPWEQAAHYNPGTDIGCQIIVATQIERSYGDAALKASLANKAASYLNENSTPTGRQFYCLQLRNIGTEEQVPAIAKYINEPTEGFAARATLTNIGGPLALKALQEAFDRAEGQETLGLMDSLSRLNDTTSLPKIVELATSEDYEIAEAAIWTLAKFGDQEAECLIKVKKTQQKNIAQNNALDNALIAAAYQSVQNGNKQKATEIYSLLDLPETPSIIRQAMLTGQFALKEPAAAHETVLAWLFDTDNVKAMIACAHLNLLSSEELDQIYDKRAEINPVAQTAFFVVHTAQDTQKAHQAALDALASPETSTRINAIRALAGKSDPSNIPQLMKCFETATDPMELSILTSTIQCFEKDEAGPVLMEAMHNPQIRDFALVSLAALKYYEAIDAMIEMARSNDPEEATSSMKALAEMCDPDKADLTRLAALYVSLKPGKMREQAERTIVLVAEKNPDPNLRADHVLLFLEKSGNDEATRLTLMPLLGKLGGPRVNEMVQMLLQDKDPNKQGIALRALCNWPNAEHIDELWAWANRDVAPAYRQMALRAYIRVATLKSDRPEAEPLTMLQNAMKIATSDADRNWCLSRAAVIRTLDSAN